jgi:hypothetical protein
MLFLKKLLIPIICMLAIMQSGCKKDSLCNCLESKGSDVAEIRTVQPFHTIEMNNNIDVILVKGTTPQVKITCGKNLIDGIKTKVENGKLILNNINRCNWLRDFKNKFTAEITYTDIDFIINNGSGNLTCSDTLKSPRFQVDSWNGTGVLNFVFDCTEVYLKLHTGPADIVASGKVGVMYVYSAGNGFVKVADVESQYTYVTTKSTGDCEVNSNLDLQATISYNGDVYYSGNPQTIKTTITGKGKLIPF